MGSQKLRCYEKEKREKTKMKPLLLFPTSYVNHRYKKIHFNFFLEYIANNTKLILDSSLKAPEKELYFEASFKGKKFVVDYCDHFTRNWYSNTKTPYFKFQTSDESIKEAIPLGPPIVSTFKHGCRLDLYNRIKSQFKYTTPTKVLNMQVPNGAALKRRSDVQNKLKKKYGQESITKKNRQEIFWMSHTNAVAVCVPGATNNMVDRGHMELMGLGVCTISPQLDTQFCYNQKLIPDEHYIQCKDDYSDLHDVIDRALAFPKTSLEIGKNAQHFFESYYSPEKYWEWIVSNL